MSEHETETPQQSPPPRRLFRSREDRVIGGVAGGLGRYFGVDPVIFRIGFVAAAFLSLIGVVLYLGALLFVPVEGEEGQAPGRRRLLAVLGVGVLAVAALWILAHSLLWSGGPFGFAPAFPFFLLLLVGAAFWAASRGSDDVGRRLAIAALVIVGVPVGLAATFWAAAEGGGAVIAGLVIAAGVLLVLAAFRGGLRWLVGPALVLAVPTAFVAAADIEFRGGYGERAYAPTTLGQLPAEYEHAAGRLEIDLRNVAFGNTERRLRVGLGMGEAVIVVPEDLCVLTRAHVGAGYLRVLDHDSGGFDVESEESGAVSAVPSLIVDADVGAGALHVVNDPRDADWERFDDRRFGGRSHDRDDDVPSLAACRATA